MTKFNFFVKDQVLLSKTKITYSLQYLNCSDSDCLCCLLHKGHGPYWQASFEIGDEIKTVFLGKKFKSVDLSKILLHDYLYKQRQEINQKKAESIPTEEKPSYLVDRIEVGKIPRKVKTERKAEIKTVPTQQDFERDIRGLYNATMPETLKQTYRQLIKKYHPDQYECHPKFNLWMSKINGEYNRLLSQVT
ncbi:MAG: hypothetical protein OEY59_03730 [Deltaproteobacteria bacterium]|nr:hypothetical protein [Deltaproteobacteria bacterium]